jgi:hypothetical protein
MYVGLPLCTRHVGFPAGAPSYSPLLRFFPDICQYIRILRNFVNWKSHSTFKFTSNCLLLATAWWFFPLKLKNLVFLSLKILVILVCGPWVKLIDILWIHKYYRTKEELLQDGIPETVEAMREDISERQHILKPILQADWVQAMVRKGRIVAEGNTKLKADREDRFGNWSERVPAFDTCRFPSIPLSSSFAQPYSSTGRPPEEWSATGTETGEQNQEGDYADLPAQNQRWSYLPGQYLEGDMIRKPLVTSTRVLVSHSVKDE